MGIPVRRFCSMRKTWGELMRCGRFYPLVNIQKTMENHHFSWVNSLFLWPCSIAMIVYQRVSDDSIKTCWEMKTLISKRGIDLGSSFWSHAGNSDGENSMNVTSEIFWFPPLAKCLNDVQKWRKHTLWL